MLPPAALRLGLICKDPSVRPSALPSVRRSRSEEEGRGGMGREGGPLSRRRFAAPRTRLAGSALKQGWSVSIDSVVEDNHAFQAWSSYSI